MAEDSPLVIRDHGGTGPTVILLHGGPGAPGSAAPLARAIAGPLRVLEPHQRGSGGPALTVARHVADLRDVVAQRCDGRPTAIAGHSWGAMLALAFAADHPGLVSAIALIGCGTFDTASRALMEETCAQRTDAETADRIAGLARDHPDPDERLRATADARLPIYSFDPVETRLESAQCDARAHRETWRDMLRLQREGVYPAALARITAPVLMLHGAHDPHPGRRIRDSLARHIPRLEYREWARCGHYPWLERQDRVDFLETLTRWLIEACGAAG